MVQEWFRGSVISNTGKEHGALQQLNNYQIKRGRWYLTTVFVSVLLG
jgi:hypothetical protein